MNQSPYKQFEYLIFIVYNLPNSPCKMKQKQQKKEGNNNEKVENDISLTTMNKHKNDGLEYKILILCRMIKKY